MRVRRGGAAAGFAFALAVGFAWLRGKVRRYEIAEHSMAPTLLPGDYVVAVAIRRPVVRGDVVILDHPDRPGFELVKRVIGLPGELVTVANGQVHIDGAVLPEPWADGPTLPGGEWRLGSDEIFLLGDHRAASAGDSRELGAVPAQSAAWSVEFRYWPVGRIGIV